jgi:hypothetical protein
MSQPEQLKIITLTFRDANFQFRVTEHTEDYLRGFFVLTDAERSRFHEMMNQEEDQDWFLDDNGYRLADRELFEKTPWTVIDRDIRMKAVLRFLDRNNGAWFCLTPWFRIGDEYNQPPVK